MGQFKDPTAQQSNSFAFLDGLKIIKLNQYWLVRHELSICKDLPLFGVELSIKSLTLQRLHDGHLGIQQCRLHAASAVWWPGLANDVINMVQRCHVCANHKPPPVEPERIYVQIMK